MLKKMILALVLLMPLSAFSGSDNYDNIETIGASNTAGAGCKVTLRDRLRYHLKHADMPMALRKQLMSKKTLISVDYFFPTNYSQLADASKDHRAEVFRLLDSWSAKYDRIILAPLPDRSQLNEDLQYFIDQAVVGGAYKNIYETLESSKYKAQAAIVNKAIFEYASTHHKIKLISFEDLLKANYLSFSQLEPFNPRMNAVILFGPDNLHFRNEGQGFLLNNVVLPALSPNIPPLLSVGVSDHLQRKILSEFLLKPKDFLEGKKGGYWVQFLNPDTFHKENALINEGKDPEKLERIKKVLGSIHDYAKSSQGFPLYLKSTATNPSVISLELTSALFFTMIDLRQSAPGVYENWSYDYWMLADLFNPPRTNYHFVLKRTADPLVMDVEWTLSYPVDGQITPLERLSVLDENYVAKAREQQKDLPSLTYKLTLQVIELK